MLTTIALRSLLSRAVILGLAVTLSAGASSCYDVGPQKQGLASSPSAAPVSIGGTVVFRERDGGFFGILADNGKQYEPINLDASYHTEGLRVRLSGVIDTAALGKHGWGNPLELDHVMASK